MKMMGSWVPDTHTLILRDSCMWVSLSFQNLIYEDNIDSVVCEQVLFLDVPLVRGVRPVSHLQFLPFTAGTLGL